MSLSVSKFKKNILASAMGFILISTAPNVMATIIDANVNYSFPIQTSSGVPITTIPNLIINDHESSSVTPSSVDVLFSDSASNSASGPNTSGNVFYHTYGNTAGNFGSRVDGSGTFDITGEFQFDETFTNSTNVSQDFTLDFTIIAGEVNNTFNSLMPGESLYSSYFIDVMVDSDRDGFFESSLFQSGISVTSSGDIPAASTIVQTGTVLNGTTINPGIPPSVGSGSAGAFWSQHTESLFLGTIAAQDSFDFRYVLTTTASGVTDINNSNNCGGFELAAVNLLVVDGPSPFGCNSAIARIGDPFGDQIPDDSSTLSVSYQATNAVPEPTGLALLGLGLSALLVNRRRKVKK